MTNELISELAKRFPNSFVQEIWMVHWPLKKSIHLDIIATGLMGAEDVQPALRCYTSRVMYLKACTAAGGRRVDLEGKSAGTISLTDAEHAARRLAGLLAPRDQKAEAARPKRRASADSEDKKSVPDVPDKGVVVNLPPPRLSLKDLREAAQARRAAAEHREDPR